MNNEYYKPNFIKRSIIAIGNYFKNLQNYRFNAVSGAIGFFVLLVAMLEYKVFESMYGMTRDIILTASTLLVTAGGGVYSEVVLRRNKDATDDQNFFADLIFYISLGTSAIVGLGAWIQAMGLETFDFLKWENISIPDFASFTITIITLVTIADILILREYFRGDVNAEHERKVARSNSKKKQADLQTEDKLIEFEAQVKTQTEQILRVEARRVEVRSELQRMYNGRVPDDVMISAMQKLDEIMQEIKTGKDLNNDGTVGLPIRQQPKNTPQVTPRSPQTVMVANAATVTDHIPEVNPTQAADNSK